MIKQQSEEQKPALTPTEANHIQGYKVISRILKKESYGESELGFLFSCAVTAALASFYNYEFGKEYVHDVSKRWGFSETEANLFGTFCGLIGLVINTAINSRSINQAYYVVKDEIIKRHADGEMPMPEDKHIRLSVGAMAFVSVIGAVPNLKFVYDTTNDKSKIYLVFMEVIQFITMSTLNLRGLHNTFKVSSEKKLVVQKFKYKLLEALNANLIDARLSVEDLKTLSRGDLVRQNHPVLRKVLKMGTGLYVGGYSSAFYFAVENAFAKKNKDGVGNDLLTFASVGCGFLSAALKWFFLGNAYAGLVDRIFNLFQEPILKVNQNEIRSKYISRNTDRVLAITGLVIAIFSLGSSSKIVEKYFFSDQEKTAETFWLSLIIGGGAALGINGTDISTMIEQLIDFGGYIFKNRILGSADSLEHYGKTHNEFIMRAMMEISIMPDLKFLKDYAIEYNTVYQQDDLEAAPLQALSGNQGEIVGHGHVVNKAFEDFLDGCSKLNTVTNDFSFGHFKGAKEKDQDKRIENLLAEGAPLVSNGMSIQ